MRQQTPVEYFDAVNKLANENQSNRTKQQTAVEWLCERLSSKLGMPIAITFYIDHELEILQAKAMEKEQIIEAHIDGQSLVSCKDEYAELYYNETYKK
jgi:hypothetical protein